MLILSMTFGFSVLLVGQMRFMSIFWQTLLSEQSIKGSKFSSRPLLLVHFRLQRPNLFLYPLLHSQKPHSQ